MEKVTTSIHLAKSEQRVLVIFFSSAKIWIWTKSFQVVLLLLLDGHETWPLSLFHSLSSEQPHPRFRTRQFSFLIRGLQQSGFPCHFRVFSRGIYTVHSDPVVCGTVHVYQGAETLGKTHLKRTLIQHHRSDHTSRSCSQLLSSRVACLSSDRCTPKWEHHDIPHDSAYLIIHNSEIKTG